MLLGFVYGICISYTKKFIPFFFRSWAIQFVPIVQRMTIYMICWPEGWFSRLKNLFCFKSYSNCGFVLKSWFQINCEKRFDGRSQCGISRTRICFMEQQSYFVVCGWVCYANKVTCGGKSEKVSHTNRHIRAVCCQILYLSRSIQTPHRPILIAV